MRIDNTILNRLYKQLNDYIQLNNKYKTKVSTYQLEKISNNLIVIEEIDNSMLVKQFGGNETISAIGYQINIYCPIDVKIENKTITKLQQAMELRGLVDDILGCKNKMNRIYAKPTPNLDNSVYRITMTYTAQYNDYRQTIV